MIYESGPWKEELDNIATELSTLVRDEDGSGSIKFEKACFLAAYIIRKLADSNKLSDDFQNEQFKVTASPYIIPSITYPTTTHLCHLDLNNNYRWQDFYNFEVRHQQARNADFICNQIRHSYIFAIYCDEKSYTGFYFNSDKTKHNFILHSTLDEFLRLIKLAANDDIVCRSERLNRKTGKWELKKSKI